MCGLEVIFKMLHSLITPLTTFVGNGLQLGNTQQKVPMRPNSLAPSHTLISCRCGKHIPSQKHRFFGWLVLHQKTLTADNLLRRHWPCDWIYCLCRSVFEDANHLARECSFTTIVWNLVCSWFGFNQSSSFQLNTFFLEWWESILRSVQGERARKTMIGALLTTWWHVWLERNRRIFKNQSQSELQVAFLVKENIHTIALSKHAELLMHDSLLGLLSCFPFHL